MTLTTENIGNQLSLVKKEFEGKKERMNFMFKALIGGKPQLLKSLLRNMLLTN